MLIVIVMDFDLFANRRAQSDGGWAKRLWHFLWHDDSAASWVANVVIAFLIIRFLFYPLLGLVLGTSFPVVAVMSESMEHGLHNGEICGQTFSSFPESFDSWWNICGYWYEDKGIEKSDFEKFPLKNGFNKGDIIVLWRANSANVEVGDVLVFWGDLPHPIIHRVVDSWVTGEVGAEEVHYQTKGDHNRDSFGGFMGEEDITEDRVLGKGIIRIPYLGWIKILFVDFLSIFGFQFA